MHFLAVGKFMIVQFI